jgi:hypothetical protein
MNIMDLHHKSQAAVALKSAAIASDTTTTGETIDMLGFEGLEMIFLTKTLSDGDYAVTLFEGEESDMSDEAAVDSAEQLGSPDFDADTDDDSVARVGYIGKMRYVRAKVVSTNTTTGIDILSGVALKYAAKHQPVADQDS